MKASLWSLIVLATLAVVWGDSESQESSECVANEVQPTVSEALTCLEAFLGQSRPTPGEARSIIKRHCRQRDPIRQCLRDRIRANPSCRNVKEVTMYFLLLAQLLEDAIDVACSHYGERLIRFVQELVEYTSDTERARKLDSTLKECTRTAGFTRPGGDVPLEKRLPNAYESLGVYRECLSGYAGEFGNVTADVDSVLADMSGKMKCPDPEREGLVSCKVLAEGGGGEDCSVVEIMVRERLGIVIDCLNPKVTVTDTLASTRTNVVKYCARQASMKQCMSEAASGANCFDRNQTRRIDLLKTNLEVILDVVCDDGGKKFARFIFEKERLPDNQLRFVTEECTKDNNIQDQKSFGLDMRTHASYIVLRNLRNCFLNKGKNVLPAINDLADLSRAVLARVQCVNPQDDSMVPCESLEEGGSGPRTCPFANETKARTKQILLQEAFSCISVKNVGFESLDFHSTPDEVRAFISEYCRKLPPVRDCLHRVSMDVDLCLGTTPRHHLFQVLQGMMETTLETGCSEDGDRLATVFAMIKDEDSGVEAALYECVDMSVLKLKLVPLMLGDEPTDSVQVFREIQSLEECVVDGIRNEPLKNFTKNFLDDVMKEIKCAETSEGETSLCKNVALPKSLGNEDDS